MHSPSLCVCLHLQLGFEQLSSKIIRPNCGQFTLQSFLTWTVCSHFMLGRTFYVTFIPVTVCECHIELKAT